MNELFAADPAVCQTTSHLKMLLNHFGHQSGRYLSALPENWRTEIERIFASRGEIEIAQMRSLLRRAKDQGCLTQGHWPHWNDKYPWLFNIARIELESGLPLHAVVIPEAHDGAALRCLKYGLMDLDLTPTADERIDSTPAEFSRVSQTLLMASSEIAFIDPYLNPTKNNMKPVLLALLKCAARGNAQNIVLHARATEIFGQRRSDTLLDDVESALKSILALVGFKPGRRLELLLWDDGDCTAKMHGRYILSIKGGIRFDQGFQVLPQGRRTDVAPIGKTTHDELFRIYFEQEHDMHLSERLVLIT